MSENIRHFFEVVKEVLEFRLLEVENYHISVYNIVELIILMIIMHLIIRGLRRLVGRKVNGKDWIDSGKQYAVVRLGTYLIYILGITFGLRSLGIDITVFIIGSSALFVGLGFGLQEAFRDFISGLILLSEGDVKVGDVIEMDNGIVGVVKVINLRTSKVRSRDGIMMVVPNSQLVNDRVINWSNSNRLTRFEVAVGVAYGSDVEKVRELLLSCATAHESISGRIKPFVSFADFGESSLDFELYFWSEEVWKIERIKSEIRFAIDKAFREHQISIPFPQRDLHLIQPEVVVRKEQSE